MMSETSSLEEPTTAPVPHSDHWSAGRWPVIAALAVAVVALAVAAVSLFNPLRNWNSYSDQQTSDAKTHVCATYAVVRRGVVTSTHLVNPVPNDPSGQLAVAANARLALIGGGAVLRNRLAAEPATPGDLATAVAALATTIEDLGTGYLAGVDSTLEPLRHNLDTEIAGLNKLCS